MIVKMFQFRFAPLVQDGSKLNTIRPRPRIIPVVGQKISLREWTGRPYRSKQRILRESIITAVSNVKITRAKLTVSPISHGKMRMIPSLDIFAKEDGFDDWEDLIAWFRQNHRLPFRGIIIFWELSSTESKSDATLPPTGKSSATPRGLGRDGNKPLMRNRKGQDRPSPTGQLAATLSGGAV